MDDASLKKYIDEVWGVYDKSNNGKLEPAELHWFFNDLFARLHDPRRYTAPEILLLFKQADVNHDGHIDKNELFRVCKLIFQKSPYVGQFTQYQAPPQNHVYAYNVQRPVGTQVLHHH